MSVFAEQLKTLRKINGLTQQEIANKIDVSRVAYTNWENGKREPELEMIIRLADIFNVSLDFLLGRYKFIDENFENTYEMIILSKNLKDLRNKNNVSQKDIASLLGISQVAYGRFELGNRIVKKEYLEILADYFDVSIDYLLGRKSERE